MATQAGLQISRFGRAGRQRRSLELLALSVGAAVLAASSSAQPAAPGVYEIDRGQARVQWKVDQLGFSNFTAQFTRFEATLYLDPAAPEQAKLIVTIDPRSIRTDFPFADHFDTELSEDVEFFNSSEHPKITFVSTTVERTGDATARVSGDLTLLGISKPLTLDVTLRGRGDRPSNGQPPLIFSATGKLKRSDFGIVTRTFIIDDVTLLIDAEFAKR
jgi:polyisoprenoid-binding protein YceI